MPTPALQLAPAFQQQDRQFQRAFELMMAAAAERAFPGAALAVTHGPALVAWKAFGRFTYDRESPAVAPTTVFDLASVSKVVATTAAAMLLYERGALDLEARVVDVMPNFDTGDSRRREVTLRMLLAHSSGLPGWEKLYERATTPEELLSLALATPLVAAPGTRTEYSDIGFIILGEILAHWAGEPLDRFCQTQVFNPLGMSSACFNPPPEWSQQIPPTLDDQAFRGRVIQAEVNDENASVLGGIAGHAGVFAGALDVATFAQCMLSGGRPILRPETVQTFTARESSPPGTSRALGWDTPSAPSQSGRYFGPRSFGHLGHTGTSLWCDPDRRLSVTLLTNRTWPDRSSQEIKRVRPLVHDAIVEAIEDAKP